jgi:hypothetical protein
MEFQYGITKNKYESEKFWSSAKKSIISALHWKNYSLPRSLSDAFHRVCSILDSFLGLAAAN